VAPFYPEGIKNLSFAYLRFDVERGGDTALPSCDILVHQAWFYQTHHLVFSVNTIGARNSLPRIFQTAPKPRVISFMEWWNYPLVIFMILLGIWMRHSAIPKQYLGILYFGIGGGLFLSSLIYYRSIIPGRSQHRKFDLKTSINHNHEILFNSRPESKT
jgi:hypothetical protein